MEINSAGYQKHHQLISSIQLRIAAMPMMMIYFLFFLLVALTAASFFMLGIKWQLAVPATKITFLIFMLAAGIYHGLLLPKCLPDVYQLGIKWQFLYSLLLAIAILFVSLFLFTLFGFVLPQYCLYAAAVFLLPSATRFSREYIKAIFTVTNYEPWLLPAAPPERKASLFINSLPVNLYVKVKCYDLQEKKFSVTIPAHLKLGEMFHRFLADNETKPVPIQLFDIDDDPFAWKFTLKKNIGNKLLDPMASLADNHIRKNSVILAERVPVS